MYVSKLATSRLLAGSLAVALWGFGATALQAKNHKDQSCGQPPQSCPAPVLQKPAPIEPACCAMPSVRPRCGAPVQTGCCPVDPKDVSKAEKDALHAQHEAAEACKKQQKAIAHAQHELEEATQRQQAKIDAANAHLNHEVSEFAEANAKYESFFGGPTEAVAEAKPEAQPEPAIVQSRPEPEPIAQAPAPVSEPAPVVENKEVIIAEVTPAPAPTPEEPQKPKQLPRTASPLSLIGLIGLMSMSGYVTRFFRR
jgi:hypothetical protein